MQEEQMEHRTGSVEVITGSMFCGKTDELIRRLRRATIARQKVQVFKPAIDFRYAVRKVTSHAGSDFEAIPIEQAGEVFTQLNSDTTVVAIDEAQFFDNRSLILCRNWLMKVNVSLWLDWIQIFAASHLDRCQCSWQRQSM
jgi:thymidine kinase